MKKIYALIGAVLVSYYINAQMMQGVFSVDPYIGIPNWANSLFYNQYNGNKQNIQDYTVVGGMISYGSRFEYMVSDNVGVGADINYEMSGFSFTFDDQVYAPDGTPMGGLTAYQVQYTAKKIRAMFRLNYHFVQSEKVDMYTAFGCGYKHVNRVLDTNPRHPDFLDANSIGAFVPVSFRIAIGTKLFFTQNVGAHVELGAFGGGLLQAGLTVKF